MLVDLYPPNVGGVERYVQSLSVELSQTGHQVTVCTLGHPASTEHDDGVKVYRLQGLFQKIPSLYRNSRKKWHPPACDVLLTNKLARLIEQEKPDIIHAHGWILYSVLPLREKYGIPIVATLHGYGYFCPRTNLVRGNSICHGPSLLNCIQCVRGDYGVIRSLAAYQGISVNKNRLKSVDKFIAVSSFVKDCHLRHLPLEDEDILVIPNFYQPDTGGVEKKVVNLPADFILFVGTMAPYKGLDVLIEAYRKLNTPTKLMVMGYRHLNYHYQNTENMIVVTDVPHDNVMQAISKCRFAVFPSICPDANALVTLEAMSERKAVIASDIGGFRDTVVNNRTGILVHPGDSDKLAKAMSCLLQKPERAAEMGENGHRRFIESYTPNVVIPRIIDTYNRLIGL